MFSGSYATEICGIDLWQACARDVQQLASCRPRGIYMFGDRCLMSYGPMPDLVPADADEAFVVPHIAMMHVHLQILDAWHVAGDIEEVD